MNSYLIPANSKKSMLYFGYFNFQDLIIFSIGLALSFLLLFLLPIEKISMAIVAVFPGCFCAFLVMPIPYYHNVRTFVKIFWNFITTRQKFIWKGWCFRDEEKASEK